MKIIVPATSANIGPGFDSVGVAVTKYLQIEVCEERDEWLIEHQIGKWIPHDERNHSQSATKTLENDERCSFGSWFGFI